MDSQQVDKKDVSSLSRSQALRDSVMLLRIACRHAAEMHKASYAIKALSR